MAAVLPLQQGMQFLGRRWWLILLPVAVALLLLLPGLSTLLSPAPTYSVVIKLTAASPAEVQAASTGSYEDSAYVPWLASEYLVINMVQWITSDSFAQEVSQQLRDTATLDIPATDLRPAFVADSARSILVMYVQWDDEREIQQIAQAAINVLQQNNQAYFPQLEAQPAQVVALDEVRVNTLSPSLAARLSPLLRLGLALGLGLALAAIVEYLDDALHQGEDLQALGLDVLGRIPSH